MPAPPYGAAGSTVRLPLFPLKAVLFPGGRLALRIFEQRYITMAKACLADNLPFGVCLITRGEEVAAPVDRKAPEFVAIGTLARIGAWDMPQLGILQVIAEGGARFAAHSHAVAPDGLVVADVTPIEPEPSVPLADAYRPLAELLLLLAERTGPQRFPAKRAFGDASWVGHRLAELLPLPLSMKQRLLEMDDADVRLEALQQYIGERGLP